MEIGVEIGAETEERAEADFHEKKICRHVGQTPKHLDDDKREAEESESLGAVEFREERAHAAGCGQRRDELIDDDLEGPGFEQIQADPAQAEREAEHGLAEEGPVIAEHAAVDRHWEFRIANSGFRLELSGSQRG